MSQNSNFIPATKKLGNDGEAHVANWLQDHGYTICERNYRLPCGEIDLIARKDDLIIFVEVKTRKKNSFPLGQVIVPSKQRKIITTAQHYIVQQKLDNMVFRFDVALLEGESSVYVVDYIENAFEGSTF